MTERYLISTNADGHLYCNYTTEKLLNANEAWDKLMEILLIDPNAKLVKVIEVAKNLY